MNATFEDGSTPLHHALRDKRFMEAALLLGLGADPLKLGQDERKTLRESLDVHMDMVVKTAKENQTDCNLSKLLPFATSERKIRVLIEEGADVNATFEDGSTPLHHALRDKRFMEAALLLSVGADPLKLGKDGKRLMKSADFMDRALIVMVWERRGTQMQQAAVPERISKLLPFVSDKEWIKKLIDNGKADVNFIFKDGSRPLHHALINENIMGAALLLGFGADPEHVGGNALEKLKEFSKDDLNFILKIAKENGTESLLEKLPQFTISSETARNG